MIFTTISPSDSDGDFHNDLPWLSHMLSNYESIWIHFLEYSSGIVDYSFVQFPNSSPNASLHCVDQFDDHYNIAAYNERRSLDFSPSICRFISYTESLYSALFSHCHAQVCAGTSVWCSCDTIKWFKKLIGFTNRLTSHTWAFFLHLFSNAPLVVLEHPGSTALWQWSHFQSSIGQDIEIWKIQWLVYEHIL